MKKQNHLCVDLTTIMKHNDIQEMQSAHGELIRDTYQHFTFVETHARKATSRPDLRWQLVERTKHGKATVNARHIKVEFYIHHTDYEDGRDLADILARETEQLGETLCEVDLRKVVQAIKLLNEETKA